MFKAQYLFVTVSSRFFKRIRGDRNLRKRRRVVEENTVSAKKQGFQHQGKDALRVDVA